MHTLKLHENPYLFGVSCLSFGTDEEHNEFIEHIKQIQPYPIRSTKLIKHHDMRIFKIMLDRSVDIIAPDGRKVGEFDLGARHISLGIAQWGPTCILCDTYEDALVVYEMNKSEPLLWNTLVNYTKDGRACFIPRYQGPSVDEVK